MTLVALSIAGSDSGGGAGIQADIRTFAAFGVYATTAVTAVTAQNARRIDAVSILSPKMVAAQIDTVFADRPPAAIKIGMLGSGGVVAAVADRLSAHRGPPVVLDPVLVSTSGTILLSEEGRRTLLRRLLPLASVVTPNLPEAALLTGLPPARDQPEAIAQAEILMRRGVGAVLIKGGHGEGAEAVDLLLHQGGVARFSASRVAAAGMHGTGCMLSSAIAAGLAGNLSLCESVARAKRFVWLAIASASRPATDGRQCPSRASHANVVESDVQGRGAVGEPSDGDEVDTGRGDLGDRGRRHPA